MTGVDGGKVICGKCEREMEPKEVALTYLGHQVTAELPVCPVCGQVYISEEVVSGKIHRVEQLLEDK